MLQKDKILVCFGEVLWDVYPDYKRIGGAPFNVSAHLSKMGIYSYMVSAVGNDHSGKEILDKAVHFGINTSCVQLNTLKTGDVEVILDENGKPSYVIKYPSAWDNIELRSDAISIVKKADVMVYGSLASRSNRSKNTLFSLLNHARTKVLDLNLRQHFHSSDLIQSLLEKADILKLNDEEFSFLSTSFRVSVEELYPFLKSTFSINTIVQTKGAKGAEVFYNNKLTRHPGYSVKVVDTVGSGDAFLAGFLYYFLSGYSIDKSLQFACALGAHIATKSGAIPDYNIGDVENLI